MCTAATYQTKDFYMGRTLDYEFSYPSQVTITPRRFPLSFRHTGSMNEHYAIIGMAQQSVEIAAWVKMVRMTTPDPDGTSIDLDDPRTLAGLNALEPVLIAQGIVSEGWAAGVVA